MRAMSIDAEPFVSLFRNLLPARGAYSEVALARRDEVPVWIHDGCLFAGVYLTVFEGAGSTALRDIKEQDVCVGRIDPDDAGRFLACLEANLRALPSLLDRWGDGVDAVMPINVLGFPEALRNSSLRSTEDFVRAFADAARVDAWFTQRADDEWNEQLSGCGLAGHGAEVRALERPSIRLRAYRIDDDDTEAGSEPIGTTRIGGAPDLPSSMEWPTIEGEPLVFVAQLDLAAFAKYPGARELPPSGVLSFFYSPIPSRGSRGETVRVIHFDSTELSRRTLPDRVDRVPEHDVELESERVFPPIESPFYEALLSEAQQREFRGSLKRAAEGGAEPVIDPLRGLAALVPYWGDADHDRPAHRVFGYAASIQGDPYVDLETDVIRGGYEGWVDDSNEALALRRSARRWRLLLQIDASGDGELVLNQDGGFFYFWITDEALRACDWSAVRGSLQCH